MADKQEILNYVRRTPTNTNVNVLGSMLDGMSDGSSGYSCFEETTLLTEESVTTQVDINPVTGEESSYAYGELAYSEFIDADTIQVTFEGKTYTCQKRSVSSPIGESYEYGANTVATDSLDFSQFPFRITSLSYSGDAGSGLLTETAGTYQIKIETFVESVEVSECFRKAVESIQGSSVAPLIAHFREDSTSVIDVTWQQVYDALASGRPIYLVGSFENTESTQTTHEVAFAIFTDASYIDDAKTGGAHSFNAKTTGPSFYAVDANSELEVH